MPIEENRLSRKRLAASRLTRLAFAVDDATKRLNVEQCSGSGEASPATSSTSTGGGEGEGRGGVIVTATSSASDVSNRHGQIIGNFQLIGVGKTCQSVHMQTKAVYQCIEISEQQYSQLFKVTERLTSAEHLWPYQDAIMLREMILPKGIQVLEAPGDGMKLLFVPCSHGSLHELMQHRDHRLNESTIRGLFSQIVRLVAFCHRFGILIRDFKLRRFVFTDQKQSTLRLHGVTDLFVCEEIADDLVRDRHGCPAYVAPELLRPERAGYAGRSADIWGLGVLLYVLLIGRYPFYGDTPQALFARIRQAKVSLPNVCAISQCARSLIFGMLRSDPSERPSANDLLTLPWISESRPLFAVSCSSSSSSVTANLVAQTRSSTAAVGVVRLCAALKCLVDKSNDDDQTVPFIGDHELASKNRDVLNKTISLGQGTTTTTTTTTIME